jgi:hypothetical protein
MSIIQPESDKNYNVTIYHLDDTSSSFDMCGLQLQRVYSDINNDKRCMTFLHDDGDEDSDTTVAIFVPFNNVVIMEVRELEEETPLVKVKRKPGPKVISFPNKKDEVPE